MSDITLYGIPNCDTVKRARAWLAGRGIEAAFHDYKKQGVPQAELRAWMGRLGWETLLNRRGPTWRKLDASRQAAVTDAASALALMVEHSSGAGGWAERHRLSSKLASATTRPLMRTSSACRPAW